MEHTPWIADLNPQQQLAVTATTGPMMILAGAGSGKTRTLVARISYLLEQQKVSSHQVLAVTFSNKAAREMRERVGSLLKIDTGTLKITTFHAFCAGLLRQEASYLGLSRHFTIYDDGESKAVVNGILKRHGISPKELSPYEILAFIEHLKNNGVYETPAAPLCNDPLYTYYQEYQQELLKANALDFGGLITGVLQLFATYPQVLAHYQKKYRYLLVDEYQDTNRAQFLLIGHLAGDHQNICVVGDEDQSIYSWRGADIRNILDFEQVFPHAQLIKLEQNYRSSRTIIEAASWVIGHNLQRKGKKMWTENAEGEAISLVECESDQQEARFLAQEILRLGDQGASYHDMGVFYRTNSQSRLLEDALRAHRIPYRVVGGMKFYDRKEIKDALAYLRIVINPQDSLALSRIINFPARGLGATSLRKLEDLAVAQHCSLWEIVASVANHRGRYPNLRLAGKVLSALQEFVGLVEELILMNQRSVPISTIYQQMLDGSGIWQFLQASKDYESAARLENLQELFSGMKQFEGTHPSANLAQFLETITLDENSLQDAAAGETEREQRRAGEVALMTVHGAKGLEFPFVFVVGAEENLFPSFKSIEVGDSGIEEERRLFYVAMTRGMKKLYLTYAMGRMLFGAIRFNGPSRFIREIPGEYYQLRRLTTSHPGQQAIPASTPLESFPVNSWVVHQLYGKGKVLRSEGQGADEKVEICFGDGAKRKFMVKFAPIVLM